MDLGSGWRELHTESGPRKCPKLFYKFTADDSGYCLALTDLIALWSEERSTEDIREYAKSTRCSIDAQEKSQLQKLLEKLGESLTASGTKSIQQNDNRGSESLHLSTTIELKRPLLPLKWEFFLESQGAAEMAEQILRPCLHEAFHAQEKIRSLFEVIATKDRAIAKLLDKFETSSMDLSLVFPSITGVRARKGLLTVQQARDHVPGLAEFDKVEWQTVFEESDSPYSSFERNGLSNLMVGCQKCAKHTSKEHQKWLHKLPKASATASQKAKVEAFKSSSPVRDSSDSETQFETQKRKFDPKEEGNEDDTDTEPEKQSTIKKLKRSLPKSSQRNGNPSSSSLVRSSSPMLPPVPNTTTTQKREASPESSDTSSEMDLDATPRTKSNTKLGALGKKSEAATNPISRSSTRSSARSHSPAFDPIPINDQIPSSPPLNGQKSKSKSRPKSSSSTMTANFEKEPQPDAAEGTKPTRSPSTPRKLGRLGKLRNSESATPDHQRTRDASASNPRSNNSSNQSTPTRRRLGRIGRSASQSQSQAPEDDTASRKQREAPPAPNEGAESDASTASTASPTPSPPPSPSTATKTNNDTSSRPPSRHGRPDPKRADSTTSQSKLLSQQSSLTDKQPTPKPEVEVEVEELTKGEKANRRREELKRKIENPGGNAASGGTTNGSTGGLRKKRKF